MHIFANKLHVFLLAKSLILEMIDDRIYMDKLVKRKGETYGREEILKVVS